MAACVKPAGFAGLAPIFVERIHGSLDSLDGLLPLTFAES